MSWLACWQTGGGGVRVVRALCVSTLCEGAICTVPTPHPSAAPLPEGAALARWTSEPRRLATSTRVREGQGCRGGTGAWGRLSSIAAPSPDAEWDRPLATRRRQPPPSPTSMNWCRPAHPGASHHSAGGGSGPRSLPVSAVGGVEGRVWLTPSAMRAGRDGGGSRPGARPSSRPLPLPPDCLSDCPPAPPSRPAATPSSRACCATRWGGAPRHASSPPSRPRCSAKRRRFPRWTTPTAPRTSRTSQRCVVWCASAWV